MELHKKTPSLWYFHRKYQETEHSLPYSISTKTCTPALFYLEVKNSFSCVTVSSAKNFKNILPRLTNYVDTPNYTYFIMLIVYMKQSCKAFINMLLGLFGNVMFPAVYFFHLGLWVHEQISGAQCLCFFPLLNEDYSWWLSALDLTEEVPSPCSVLSN